jgi:hypothetical protein
MALITCGPELALWAITGLLENRAQQTNNTKPKQIPCGLDII